MRLIEAADAELFEAVGLAARIGRAERMLDRLEDGWSKNPDDPDAAFRYALALLATLPTGGSEIEVYGRFGAVTEALDRVVDAVPGHWPARYLRIRLSCLLLLGHDATAAELERTERELDALIDLQSQAGPQPYFAATLILAVRLAEWPGRSRDADRVAGLRAALAGDPGRPLPFRALAAVLGDPFVAGYAPTPVPERRDPARPEPEPAELAGRALLLAAAAGLSRLTGYLRIRFGSFADLPGQPGSAAAADAADEEVESTLRAARDVRAGLRAWADGDADAAAITRPAIPGLRYALEDFLTHCETTISSISGRPELVSDDAGWLPREMAAVRSDVERLITLLLRCRDLATA